TTLIYTLSLHYALPISSLSFLTCSGLSTMSRYLFISGERRIGMMKWGSDKEESDSSRPVSKTPKLRVDDGSLSNSGGLFRGGIRSEEHTSELQSLAYLV